MIMYYDAPKEDNRPDIDPGPVVHVETDEEGVTTVYFTAAADGSVWYLTLTKEDVEKITKG